MTGWLGYALLALAFWGGWGLFSKMAAVHLPVRQIFIVELGAYLVVAAAVLVLRPQPLTWPAAGVAAALGAGFCGALGLFCFLGALGAGQAAVVVPLTALYPIVTVILSLVFLQEALSLRQVAGIVLALGAVWLLSQ